MPGIVNEFCATMCRAPYGVMPSESSNSPTERSRITAPIPSAVIPIKLDGANLLSHSFEPSTPEFETPSMTAMAHTSSSEPMAPMPTGGSTLNLFIKTTGFSSFPFPGSMGLILGTSDLRVYGSWLSTLELWIFIDLPKSMTRARSGILSALDSPSVTLTDLKKTVV